VAPVFNFAKAATYIRVARPVVPLNLAPLRPFLSPLANQFVASAIFREVEGLNLS
jgi:hypothetical protein